LLGDTLEQIAYEKGGIIKPGVPVVSAPQKEEAIETLSRIALERGAPLTVVGRDWRYQAVYDSDNKHIRQRLVVLGGNTPSFIPGETAFAVGLSGGHQIENAAVALAALEKVRDRFPRLDLAALKTGLATVQWDGRLQTLQEGPDRPAVLVDCAHNEDSAARLVEALAENYRYKRLVLVFGAPEDKNVAGMMARLVPLADELIVTTANHPRSAAPERLAEMAGEFGRAAIITHSVSEAMSAALTLAGPGDLVLATGSIIVVGDLLNHWDILQSNGSTYG
jgi:dihydrofolate synthase/folylpolyglutamate synthase